MLYISIVDIKTKTIPNKLVLAIVVLAITRIAVSCITESSILPLLEMLIGLVAGGLPFAIIILLTKGGMGAGDMKLYAALGMFFGWKGILCIIIISILTAGIFALVLVLAKIKNKKYQLALAPFIAAATIITIAFKPQIYLFLQKYYGI